MKIFVGIVAILAGLVVDFDAVILNMILIVAGILLLAVKRQDRGPVSTDDRNHPGLQAIHAHPPSEAFTDASHPPGVVDQGQTTPTIVTRTRDVRGVILHDPYKYANNNWTSTETLQLLEQFEISKTLTATTHALQKDKKQIAIRLVEILLRPVGDMEDASQAENSRKRYQPGEKDRIIEVFQAGEALSEIASRVGRTQLAVGWQLLESKNHPVGVPASLKARIRKQSLE